MSQTYIGAIEEHCPNATLVLDRFHIVKAFNAAVDEVRKDQWRTASKNERKILKGLRWLLFKHSENRSKKDSRILNRLRVANRKIHRAWVL
jgi:transposase